MIIKYLTIPAPPKYLITAYDEIAIERPFLIVFDIRSTPLRNDTEITKERGTTIIPDKESEALNTYNSCIIETMNINMNASLVNKLTK
ncbi:hypothetical protein BJG07_16880 [Escherichia coli]|nr:hypothetical protein BJG07_16880 [Escherichia coli]BEC44498.1 hypothetical protein VEE52_48210 [Escherichia coli]